jgi:hypothetical protein
MCLLGALKPSGLPETEPIMTKNVLVDTILYIHYTQTAG